MVLKGIAPLSLVDSYGTERIPIADEIIQLSAKNLDLFVSESYLFFQVRKYGLILLSYILPYLPSGIGGPTFAMVCFPLLFVCSLPSFIDSGLDPFADGNYFFYVAGTPIPRELGK